MRFLPDSGLLILHIPRTGGTFVQKAIAECGIRASRWARARTPEFLPSKHELIAQIGWRSMSQVKAIAAFVRHPVAYYISVWQYLSDEKDKGHLNTLIRRWPWHPFRRAAILYHSDFGCWLEGMAIAEPAWVTRLYESYVGPEGGEFCDFIGRTETLADDLIALLRRYGYEIDEDKMRAMDRINCSTDRPAERDGSLWQRILDSEKVVLRRFYDDNAANRRYYNGLHHGD